MQELLPIPECPRYPCCVVGAVSPLFLSTEVVHGLPKDTQLLKSRVAIVTQSHS